VFPSQGSAERGQGFRETSLRKYLKILIYRDILVFEKIRQCKKDKKML
jgi:hypothetical protein